MTIGGSGVGGNIGGPAQPSSRDIETTAWTNVNKAALGIVPDSLEISFSQLGGNVWKYQSDSSRPTLKPLGQERTSGAEEPPDDDSWKPLLDELTNQLHPELRSRLMGERNKPFATRDANYSILDNVLKQTAKGMAWLDKARLPVDPQSPAGDRTILNQSLPGHALRGAVFQGQHQLKAAEAYLKYATANLPQHDDLLNFINEGKMIQEDLDSVLLMLQMPDAPPPDQEDLKSLSNAANALANKFNLTPPGNNLQMLGPMFEAMAAVASALSLTPTSPTLYLGLKMASRGLFSSDSLAGLLGGDLGALMKALTGGMNSSMGKAGIAKQMMLIMTLLSTTSGATTLAGLLAEFGIGRFPAETEEEEEEGDVFTMQLVLEMLASSGLIKTMHEIAAQAAGAGEKAQKLISEGMEVACLLLMALAGAKGDPTKAADISQGVKERMLATIDSIEKSVLENLREESSISAKVLDVHLKQALITLKNDDFNGLIGTGMSLLGMLSCSLEGLDGDLKDMAEFGKVVAEATSAKNEARSLASTSSLRVA